MQDARLTAKLGKELDGLREMQACLLPDRIPQIPGYDVYPFYRSATEVGGAWYDFAEPGGGRLVAVVGESSVSGIPGAMVMAMASTLVRALAPLSGSPTETLRRVNAQIGGRLRRGTSVTVLLAELHVKSRMMTVCLAGGCPVIVFRQGTGECEELGGKGIALGVADEDDFGKELTEERVQLQPGDRVVMFISGVVRLRNSRDEEYGLDRLLGCVKKHAPENSRDLIRAVVRDLEEHMGDRPQEHDIIILTFRVLPE